MYISFGVVLLLQGSGNQLITSYYLCHTWQTTDIEFWCMLKRNGWDEGEIRVNFCSRATILLPLSRH